MCPQCTGDGRGNRGKGYDCQIGRETKTNVKCQKAKKNDLRVSLFDQKVPSCSCGRDYRIGGKTITKADEDTQKKENIFYFYFFYTFYHKTALRIQKL